MASTSETGHTKNVTNFETLLINCKGFGAGYNPTNTALTIATLTAQHVEAKAAIKEIKTTETPFKSVEGERQTLYKPLKPLATKVINALIAAGAPATVIADAKTINRKLQGKRANTKTTETIPNEEPTNTISVAQTSYDMLLDNLEKLIELANVEHKYNPNEEDLKTEALIAYKEELESINTKFKTFYVPYKNALQTRNEKFYTPQTGLVDTALTVKIYVKSVFGATSPQYKQISKLAFKKYK